MPRGRQGSRQLPSSTQVTVHRKNMKARGRQLAVELLDTLLSRSDNILHLKEAMQDRFDLDPLAFFQEVAVPLMPKEMILRGDQESSKGPAVLEIIFTEDTTQELPVDPNQKFLPPGTIDITSTEEEEANITPQRKVAV